MKNKITFNFKLFFSLFVLISIVFLCLFAPFTAHKIHSDVSLRLLPPSSRFWLGTDSGGMDLYTALLLGGRISLMISSLVVFSSTFIGIILGTVSGHYGKITDQIIMRTIDLLSSFPGILLAMIISGVFGSTFLSVILALSITAWIGPAKITRASIISLKNSEFIEGARAIGASDFRIIYRHLLPQVLPFVLIQMCLSFSGVIIVESTLSFLGLGPSLKYPTWGQLIGQGKTVLHMAPHLTIIPGLCIFLFVLSLNFLGDILRDILDPKQHFKIFQKE